MVRVRIILKHNILCATSSNRFLCLNFKKCRNFSIRTRTNIILKNICHEPDWCSRYNSLHCFLKSTGLRLTFHCNEIREAEMKSRKAMEFHSTLRCCINQLLTWHMSLKGEVPKKARDESREISNYIQTIPCLINPVDKIL